MRPKTKTRPNLFETMARFATAEQCAEHYEKIRWPNGPCCIKCGSVRVFKYETAGKTGKMRNLYQCVDCKYQFSLTTGSIFHNSHAPLNKWFLAIYLICFSKKGISALQLKGTLEVSYETAWYMAHRIRVAMQEDGGFLEKFSGIVEADETYIGGKGKGLHGRSTGTKTPVLGAC